jgi:hypothetical protein
VDELLIYLCILAFVLTAVTVVGHALWLLVAALFRGLRRPASPPRRTPGPPWDPCARCGLKLPWDVRDCPRCGLDRDSQIAAELADLEAMVRQLERFEKRHLLSCAEIQRLWQVVQERQRRLGMAPLGPLSAELATSISPAPEELPEVLPATPARVPQGPVVEPEPILEVLPVQQPSEPLQSGGRKPPEPHSGGLRPPPREAVPAAPSVIRRPRRSLGELLAGFMEEKNILWGELVGGLLIVGGSVALVISLWNTLQENPYFPFGIFAAVTAALYGAGLYTLHHWKLGATSRGLLVIATLLVPLCFTVLPSMLEQEAGDNLELLTAGGSLLVFLALIYQAGRVLVPGGGWLLTLAVLGCAASQLLGARLLGTEPAGPVRLLLLGCLPLACQTVGTGLLLWRLGRTEWRAASDEWRTQSAFSLLALVGLATFALALALGVFLFRFGNLEAARHYLSLLIAASAVPVLACGLVLHTGLADGPRLAGLRTTGTAVALVGTAIMVLTVALAWPLAEMVLAVCAVNFVVLSWVAFRRNLPAAHAVALPCLTLGYLLALHLIVGTATAPLLERIAVQAGAKLAALVLILLGVGEVLARQGRRPHALAYSTGAGLLALVSLALVTWQGLDKPGQAAAVCAIYAAAALVVNLRWRHAGLTCAGLALACAATLWALHAGWPERWPLWAMVLAAEALLLAVVFLLPVPEALAPAFRRPAVRSAAAIGWLAAVLGVMAGVLEPWRFAYVVTALCLLALHLVLTLLERRTWPARVAGLMLLGSVAAAAGWAGMTWGAADLGALIALCLAVTSTLLCLAAGLRRTLPDRALTEDPRPNEGSLAVLFAPAWREVTVLAAVLAAVLAVGVSLPETRLHTATAFSLTATAWLLTWRYRVPALSWIGSTLLLLGLVHLLSWSAELTTPRWAALALLLHASTLLGPVLMLRGIRRQGNVLSELRYLFAGPLTWAALVSTFLALPVLVLLDQGAFLLRGQWLTWLAALWLVGAGMDRRHWLFAGFQAVLCLAVGFAVTAWLQEQPWVLSQPVAGLWDPRSLQAYGLGLTGLCLAWGLARIAFQRSETGRCLLLPDWPGVDRLVLGALLLGQMAFADWGVVPGALSELVPRGYTILDFWPAVHVYAYGPGGWLLLAGLALVCLLNLWQPAPERRQQEAVLGLLVLLTTAPVLWAGPYAAENATASALRWGLTTAFLVGSVLLWLCGPASALARWLRMPAAVGEPEVLAGNVASAGNSCWGGDLFVKRARRCLLDFTLVPVLVLTAAAATLVLAGMPPTGPTAESFFRRIGGPASLLLPLVALSLGLVGHALRERSAGYAFAAGLVVLGVATGGYAVSVVRAGRTFGNAEEVQLLQLGSITASAWALVWLASRRWLTAWREGPQRPLARPLMMVQLGLGLSLNVVCLGNALLLLYLWPDEPMDAGVLQAGQPAGWLALVLAAAAALWRLRPTAPPLVVHALGGIGMLLAVLLAASASPWDAGGWFAYHVLLTALMLLAGAILLLGWIKSESEQPFLLPAIRHWIEALGLVLVGLALRGTFADPAAPYWPAGTVLGVSLLAGALAFWSCRPVYVPLSGLLLLLASLLVWAAWGWGQLDSFLYVCALGLGAGSAIWSVLEGQLRRRIEMRYAALDQQILRPFPFSQVAGLVGLNLLVILVGLGLGSDLSKSGLHLAGPLAWAAWGMTALAALARLWDTTAVGRGLRTVRLYVSGLLGVSLLLHSLALPSDALLWSAALTLAGYALAAVLLAQAAPHLGRVWQQLRVPAGQGLEDWLFPLQAVLTGVALLLSVWVSFAFALRQDRLAGPLAVALLTATWVVWTHLREQGLTREPSSLPALRYAVLLLGALVPAEIAWALPEHVDPAVWLYRDVLLFAALALTAAGYALGLRRLLPSQERWSECAERLGPRLGAAAVLVVLIVLVQELALYDPAIRGVALAPWAAALVAFTLLGLSVAALCFAVAPHVDPLALPASRRPLYVYAAELVLALLFLHVRLTMPFLFRGALALYWPFLLMGLAFLGVGLAELFERRGLRVLAEPLQKTGIFLPFLPLVAFWLGPLIEPFVPAAGGRVRPLPAWLEHAGVWYLLGVLYAWVAVMRRSSRFALLAALAVNFGTWALLYHYREHGVGFLAHPQLWLIPLALIVLTAEHLNRDRLPAAQALALRYFGLVLLYVSSTADLLLAGLGDIGLSLVLAVLSVLGVLAGIQLRVRAFLFAGLTFLLLVIFVRIWYAAVTQAQTWVWWVSLIVLGIAILALFAVFEKRRNDVLRLVEELKRWR